MSGKILWLKPRHKGIYLLPNMLTTVALCFGFLSILLSLQTDIVGAARCIFFALIADGLDGRVARMTNTQSEFGKQYDSLSDMVAFGVAPAILILTATVGQLGHFGWGAVFSYTAFTAIRLAKFNIKSTGVGDFKGLPCPSAALFLASSVWLFANTLTNIIYAWLFSAIVVLLGVLMVSSIPYPSFKQFNLKDKYSKFIVLVMVAICAMLLINPALCLWLFFLAYVLFGPIKLLIKLVKQKC